MRRVVTRRNSSTITGQFNSIREDNVVRVCKNGAEFLYFSILDTDPEVRDFRTDPASLTLASGESFVPDTYVEFRTGRRPVYQKVAWLRSLREDRSLAAKLPMIAAACDDLDADFEAVTEVYWKNADRVAIAKAIRHASRRASRLEMDVVLSALQDGALSVAELKRETGLAHAAKFAALSLCARGKVCLRRDRPLSETTLFWLLEDER